MAHIDAGKLIAEIKRRLHFDNNWIEGDKRRQMRTSGVSSAYYKRIGSKHACESFLDFVISLQQEQPSLSSGLDDAAEKYSENILANNEDLQDAIEDAFKAGAEWMAEQGVKLKCWIARDECSGDESNLYIGQKKPRRIPETAPGFGMWCDYGEFMALPPDMFPELTYSDEPIEVELIIRKK